MSTGRYTVVDLTSGRRFVVEPIHGRNEKATDRIITNGGTDGSTVKNKSEVQGGSVSEEESVITPENGFKDIRYAPAGVSPMDIIEQMLENPKLVIENDEPQ
jgi:hypothetical protein